MCNHISESLVHTFTKKKKKKSWSLKRLDYWWDDSTNNFLRTLSNSFGNFGCCKGRENVCVMGKEAINLFQVYQHEIS